MKTSLRRSGMARVLNGSHIFTCTPHVHPLTEWTIPVFAFLPKAGTHLLTPEVWKAELALGGWLHTEVNARHRELNANMVTHLSTNRACHRLTSLIETNSLPLPGFDYLVKIEKNALIVLKRYNKKKRCSSSSSSSSEFIILLLLLIIAMLCHWCSLGGLVLDHTIAQFDGIAAFQPVINGMEMDVYLMLR